MSAVGIPVLQGGEDVKRTMTALLEIFTKTCSQQHKEEKNEPTL